MSQSTTVTYPSASASSSLRPAEFITRLVEALNGIPEARGSFNKTSATTLEMIDPATMEGEKVPSKATITATPAQGGSEVTAELEVNYAGMGAMEKMLGEGIFASLAPQLAQGLVDAVDALGQNQVG